MMRYSILYFSLFLVLLYGCGGDNGGGNDGSSETLYSVSCAGEGVFAPDEAPVTRTVASATTTVIHMHGKTGHPNSGFIQGYYDALADAGYNVIAPKMPWSGEIWTGTLCEGLNYLQTLVDEQRQAGQTVIVSGHSMGGIHALAFGVMDPIPDIEGIVVLAPGHMMHRSTRLQEDTAADVERATDLVNSGQGDIQDSFVTRNGGMQQTLTATPVIYLSYHDLNQFPDVNAILPAIRLPVLWLAGDADPLTTNYDMAVLSSRIESPNSDYQLISGDHLGLTDNAEPYVTPWLSSLGF